MCGGGDDPHPYFVSGGRYFGGGRNAESAGHFTPRCCRVSDSGTPRVRHVPAADPPQSGHRPFPRMAPVCRRCGARLPELASFSLPTPNPWLVLYRFVWLSFLTFIIVRLIVYNRSFGQITPDPVIRLTTLAMVIAGLFALGVIVTTMAEPLLPATSSAVYPVRVLLELCVLGMATSFVFSTLPTWNPRLGGPTVARFVVSASAYRRLSPLWRTV